MWVCLRLVENQEKDLKLSLDISLYNIPQNPKRKDR